MAESISMLNLGCGTKISDDPVWVNVDFNSSSDKVISYNILEGIPFPDQTFEVVYHSHFLEHLSLKDGVRLINECFRVLKNNGIIRISVPNLENICRLYLLALDKAEAGDLEWQNKYDWLMIELYDQAVRNETGGEMLKYLRSRGLQHKDFIIERIGSVGKKIIESSSKKSSDTTSHNKIRDSRSGLKYLFDQMERLTPRRVLNKLRRIILSSLLSKNQKKALMLGEFRLRGEAHQWMYDSYSMRRLLSDAGFNDYRQCSATDSQVEKWNNYFLDIDREGFEHAPSSLYVEAVKR